MLCILAVLLYQTISASSLSSSDIDDLRTDIRALIDDSTAGNLDNKFSDLRPLLAGLVRLAFHDCAAFIQLPNGTMSSETGCDGCIQPHFSHVPNRFIHVTVDEIEPLYLSKYSEIMSRADYWANSGLLAAEYGAELAMKARNNLPGATRQETDSGFEIEAFYFGREDCRDGPYYNDTTINNDQGIWINFPQPHFTLNQTLNFFSNKYGLSNRETVAVLGAHTLGRSRDNWGDGGWTPDGRQSEGIVSRPDTLDNQFYIDMIDGSDTGSSCRPIPDTNVNWRSIQIETGGPQNIPARIRGRRVYVHEDDYEILINQGDINESTGRLVIDRENRRSYVNGSLMFSSDMALWYEFISISGPGSLVLSCIDEADNTNVLEYDDGTLLDGHDAQDCAIVPFETIPNECDCQFSKEDQNGAASRYVRLYAMDNKLWLEDYAKVFVKISSVSPTPLQRVRCS